MLNKRVKIFITIGCIIAIISLISNPTRYIQSAYNGFILFATGVLPALFPFFFFSKVLAAVGAASMLSQYFKSPIRHLYNAPASSSYILIMSMISGYPIGASLIASFHEQGYITPDEARTITSYASTSGSLFIIGTVATQMFHNKNIGYIVIGCHFAGAILNGLLYRCKKNSENKNSPTIMVSDNILNDSISNSISSILSVGAFIAIFSIIIDICYDLQIIKYVAKTISIFGVDESLSQAIIVGLMELTRGCLTLSQLNLPVKTIAPILCFVISFGGIGVALQSMNYLSRCGIKTSSFLLRKLTQAIISMLLCLALCAFL